jgi:hypothetical protein
LGERQDAVFVIDSRELRSILRSSGVIIFFHRFSIHESIFSSFAGIFFGFANVLSRYLHKNDMGNIRHLRGRVCTLILQRSTLLGIHWSLRFRSTSISQSETQICGFFCEFQFQHLHSKYWHHMVSVRFEVVAFLSPRNPVKVSFPESGGLCANLIWVDWRWLGWSWILKFQLKQIHWTTRDLWFVRDEFVWVGIWELTWPDIEKEIRVEIWRLFHKEWISCSFWNDLVDERESVGSFSEGNEEEFLIYLDQKLGGLWGWWGVRSQCVFHDEVKLFLRMMVVSVLNLTSIRDILSDQHDRNTNITDAISLPPDDVL